MTPDPAGEYRARLAARRARLALLSTLDARIAVARIIVFAAVVLAAVLAVRGGGSAWWIALPAAAFLALVVGHARVIGARDAAAAAAAFYERGLGRLEDRWTGTGATGDRFRDDRHPYANDLDLFGPGSLFELLSLARTPAGEDTLAGWLARPADSAALGERHVAVRELTPALDLREALSQAGADVRARVDTEALVAWAEAPPALSPPWHRAVAVVLTALTLAALAWTLATGDTAALLSALGLQSLFALPRANRVTSVLHAADGPARGLAVLSHALALVQREQFAAPRLAAIKRELESDGAAAAIRRLTRLAEMHDWQHNVIFVPVALLLLWGTHLAWSLEAWRRAHGTHVRRWVLAVGELEALASISAYAYEHPADPYPELVAPARSAAGTAVGIFEGVGLGHPLVPAARMVPNDVTLSGPRQLLVISGSNMSGKSTLLRTIGINAVLAQAGAPVRATSLRMSRLTVGATLRIQDSLQEGRSRFYAEITRVRELADLSKGPVPLLFLLDELFHGTNSHDRLIGSSGVLRSLIARGAIGLVTTHDLALTAVATELEPHADNVHFEDWFEGGEMRFDYRMKPGPVARSNALALMRAVGLDVEGS